MRRRTLLAVVAGLAGCQFGSGTQNAEPSTGTERPGDRATPTARRTQTPAPESPTATATPTPESSLDRPLPSSPPQNRPYVTAAGLVERWSETGDLATERVDRVARGRPAIVAYRYAIRLEPGTQPFTEGVTVTDGGGESLGQMVREVSHTVESAGIHRWESAVTFETAEWSPGDVTAAVQVGDPVSHRVSDPVRTTFAVTER